jgi:mono/diheme cytochrome c family protein
VLILSFKKASLKEKHTMRVFMNKTSVIIMLFLIASFSSQGIAFSAETSGNAALAQGKTLYENKCADCHGTTGKGNGPSSKKLGVTPGDLTSPETWKGNAPERIRGIIEDGSGAMPPVEVSPGEASAIVEYMSRTFRSQDKK